MGADIVSAPSFILCRLIEIAKCITLYFMSVTSLLIVRVYSRILKNAYLIIA